MFWWRPSINARVSCEEPERRGRAQSTVHPSNANLQFNQFDVLPYIGDGSPVAQAFWMDDLTVATAKP